MYQGRHCSASDYQLLAKFSKEFLSIINRDKFELKEVEKYLHTFSDFDDLITLKIRTNLEKINTEKELSMTKIRLLLEELSNNVLVDIKEHN